MIRHVGIYNHIGVQHLHRNDLKINFVESFLGSTENLTALRGLCRALFLYILFSLTSCQFKYDTLQVKSDILDIIGSSLMDQILSLQHVWIWYSMSHPPFVWLPHFICFFPLSTRWGSTPWTEKKKRCFGITEAYIDTVLSSKEFITSAQNAHGFLLAENGKVWVMFFWGGQQGGNKYLGGWVELWLGVGREKRKNHLWWFQSVDIEHFAFLMIGFQQISSGLLDFFH